MDRASLCILSAVIVAGCASPPGGFNSPDPAERLRAITRAAKERDQSSVPHLIESLNHDDPAVRLAAIRTLESLTGQTLGYDYAATEWRRREMIRAWAEWNSQHNPPKPSSRGGPP